jgi:hypothetical protein
VIPDRLAFFTADLTAETVFTNTTGEVAEVDQIICANPSTGAATVVRITIGVDGATTRAVFIPVPAGENTVLFDARLVYEGTEVMQAASSVTDDVVVVTVVGRVRLVS